MELQQLAMRRMRGTRANLADGAKAAKEVYGDLKGIQRSVKYVTPSPFFSNSASLCEQSRIHKWRKENRGEKSLLAI
jgi:hypothetical protein